MHFQGISGDLLPFKLHAGYVMFWALTVFAMRWEKLGSMFGVPEQALPSKKAYAIDDDAKASGKDSVERCEESQETTSQPDEAVATKAGIFHPGRCWAALANASTIS